MPQSTDIGIRALSTSATSATTFLSSSPLSLPLSLTLLLSYSPLTAHQRNPGILFPTSRCQKPGSWFFAVDSVTLFALPAAPSIWLLASPHTTNPKNTPPATSHPDSFPRIPSPPSMSSNLPTETRDAAIRDAKLFIREVVRNDWEFELSAVPDGAHSTTSPSTTEPLSSALANNREAVEWREREFDSSGSELEPQSSDHDLDLETSSALKAAGDLESERRRKRRRQMEEEMAWNEGLRVWHARRDAWSGARTRRQIRAWEKRKVAADDADEKQVESTTHESGSPKETDVIATETSAQPVTNGDAPDNDDKTIAVQATKAEESLGIADHDQPREEPSQRRQDQEEEQSTAPDEETKRKGSTETSITEPDQHAPPGTDAAAADSEEDELDEPLLPVAPPFISTSNPIRAGINSSIYPSIYTKVVVQGMTPTVPVNLADLTKAMVQGWKTDGQWPPKPAVSNIVLADDASVPKKDKDADRAAGDRPARRKDSITSAVRKVFQMGSQAFHRRGSNSHDVNSGGAGSASGSRV